MKGCYCCFWIWAIISKATSAVQGHIFWGGFTFSVHWRKPVHWAVGVFGKSGYNFARNHMFPQATALITSWPAMTDSRAFPLCQRWTCSKRCLWVFHCDSNGRFFNKLRCGPHVNTSLPTLFPLWNDAFQAFCLF